MKSVGTKLKIYIHLPTFADVLLTVIFLVSFPATALVLLDGLQ